MNDFQLIAALHAAGLVTSSTPLLQPLPGGVSSDIVLVSDGARRYVVKRALEKLKVKDNWFADISRNQVERAYLEYAARIVPGAVPRVLAGDAKAGWFAMEYCGDGFVNWKQQLLTGEIHLVDAQRAGTVLGKLHHASWGDTAVQAAFSTGANFHALRIESYLLTTAARVPEARDFLEEEARRLARTALALVHGDFSPKNLLVTEDRLIVLDAEVAWYGDPAFDTAFLLNHLHLKALVQWVEPAPLLALVPAFLSAYTTALREHASPELERRTVRLLLGLLLARVHGKSPAEYLKPAHHRFITQFVLAHLAQPPATLAAFTAVWHTALLSS